MFRTRCDAPRSRCGIPLGGAAGDGDAGRVGHGDAVAGKRVDDLADQEEPARAELESRGVEFTGDIFDTGACHMAFFQDPDGNQLMLHHRYAPRVTES